MEDRLRLLVELQEIDREVLAMRQRFSRLPEEAKKRSAVLEDKQEKLRKAEQTQTALKLDSRELEGEANALNSQITRSQDKVLELRNEREFRAMKTQIANLKADLKRNEDLQLEVMGQLDLIAADVDKLKTDIAFEQGQISSLNEQADREREEARDRMNELREEREKVLRRIDPADYESYKRLMRPPEFKAVAPVTEDGMCTACHVRMEPQALNMLYIGREMVCCSNCGRMLYLKDRA